MPEESELAFEEAVARLEEIVESLERGEPDLAAALAQYEAGVRLLTRCHAQLERAERAVALLTGVDDEGRPVTAPFDASATLEASSPGTPAPVSAAGAGPEIGPPRAAAPKSGRSRKPRAPVEPEPEPEPDADEFGDVPF